MDPIKEDVEKALGLITRKDENIQFSKHCAPFLFSTESQSEVNKAVNYFGKDVLTVNSSGDQYLGASYYGAKNIELYDINRLTRYITYLKIIAIANLSYEEFIDFFVPVHKEDSYNPKFWDLRTLKKLLYALPKDVAYFWDNIMYSIKKIGFGEFVFPFHKHALLQNVKSGMPFYESKEEYYKLQTIIRKRNLPTIHELDISSLSKIVKSDFDIVYLSNIIECMICRELDKYPFGACENLVEQEVIKKTLKEVMPLLRDDGTVLVDYRSNTNRIYSTDYLFCNDFFDVTEFESKFPPDVSLGKYAHTDLALTYKPKRKGNILDHL